MPALRRSAGFQPALGLAASSRQCGMTAPGSRTHDLEAAARRSDPTRERRTPVRRDLAENPSGAS